MGFESNRKTTQYFYFTIFASWGVGQLCVWGFKMFPSLKQPYDSSISPSSSTKKRGGTMLICAIGGDILPFQQQLDHTFVSLINSPPEWCSIILIREIGVDILSF